MLSFRGRKADGIFDSPTLSVRLCAYANASNSDHLILFTPLSKLQFERHDETLPAHMESPNNETAEKLRLNLVSPSPSHAYLPQHHHHHFIEKKMQTEIQVLNNLNTRFIPGKPSVKPDYLSLYSEIFLLPHSKGFMAWRSAGQREGPTGVNGAGPDARGTAPTSPRAGMRAGTRDSLISWGLFLLMVL